MSEDSIHKSSGGEDLNKYVTNGSINIPMDVFEKIYLNPQLPVKGDLRKTFGNPTPLCLLGFLVAATPLGAQLMGWRGSGGGGAAIVAPLYFFGGMLQIIGSTMEWIIGNTFPFVVFGSFGAFWLSLAATLTPYYNAVGAFIPAGATAAEAAAGQAQFYSSFAFYLCFFGLLTVIYTIAAIRTNIVFVVIFILITIGVEVLAAAYWALAEGKAAHAAYLEQVAGGFVFAFSMLGWYLLLSQTLQAVDFPLSLPVGDLSRVVKGASERKKKE